jgi:hypothetical protein
MVLGQPEEMTTPVLQKAEENKIEIEAKKEDLLAPKLVDDFNVQDTPMPMMNDMVETEYIKEEEPIVLWQLAEAAMDETKVDKLPW